MISGDGQRLIQLGETGVRNNDNVSFIRSSEREARDREERARLNPQQDENLTPQQRAGKLYEQLWKQEQRQKQQDDADAIARGSLKILPDGTRVEEFSGFKRR
jgi:hypothetical protein